MSAVIGIDHGRLRIGLAVGSEETGQAFARPAVQGRSQALAAEQIGALAQAEGTRRVVLGLPRNMDGSEGPQAAAARAFGKRLGAIGLEVTYVDERLTSWEAGEQVKASGRAPHRASGELDSAAARLILQDYLDARAAQARQQETR